MHLLNFVATWNLQVYRSHDEKGTGQNVKVNKVKGQILYFLLNSISS